MLPWLPADRSGTSASHRHLGKTMFNQCTVRVSTDDLVEIVDSKSCGAGRFGYAERNNSVAHAHESLTWLTAGVETPAKSPVLFSATTKALIAPDVGFGKNIFRKKKAIKSGIACIFVITAGNCWASKVPALKSKKADRRSAETIRVHMIRLRCGI